MFVFVLADMLDGAMARERGGGTRFGAVLDATCDRISDGAIFCGLLWWVAFGLNSPPLVVATMICLVTSQVISYVKARAEASGLEGGGGLIERPERLIIVLTGPGFRSALPARSDTPAHRDVDARRCESGDRRATVHAVRSSPDAMAKLPLTGPAEPGGNTPGGNAPSRTASQNLWTPVRNRLALGEHLADWGYATGWRMVRVMPETLARNAFGVGARYAARGGPQQLRKNLGRVIGKARTKCRRL